jgi:hypothetical protein
MATTIETLDSSNFTTTETEIASVTAPLVNGRVYKVRASTHIGTSVANDVANMRIREDTVAGNELNLNPNIALPNAGVAGNYSEIEVEYTAVATGNKTFSLTASRAGGSGNLRREAAGNRPTYFYVDYIRG